MMALCSVRTKSYLFATPIEQEGEGSTRVYYEIAIDLLDRAPDSCFLPASGPNPNEAIQDNYISSRCADE
jgi:hypothetical protein